ncbi:MAG TPA: zinc ABC transporter substrate-binding protein [Salinivirgaceae bacterium]|nr:zinc ABC transporter substrate-binding protein [Salinivirgaceae bacterium]
MNKSIVIIILAGWLLVGCNSQPMDKTMITVTISTQKYWIDKLAGDLVSTNVMLLTGADHETYEPTPQQMRIIASSKIYFSLGSGLGFEEQWVKKFSSLNPQLKVVSLLENIKLPEVHSQGCNHHHKDGEHEHPKIDPHVWLDPMIVKTMIPQIAAELKNLFPEHKDSIENREQRFLHAIDTLHSYIERTLSNSSREKFLVFHPALTWFAYRYNLTQLVIEQEGKEPSPAQLQEIINYIINEKIDILLIQKEFPSEKARSIAEATGIKVITINPLAYEWEQTLIDITHCLIKN